MARITIEDCLENVDNRFDLVLLATKRARQLANGRDALVDWEDDKPTVVALREIALGLIDHAYCDRSLEIEEEIEEEISIQPTEAPTLSTPAAKY